MRRIILALVIIMMVFAACKGKPSPPAGQQQAQQVQPAEAGKKAEGGVTPPEEKKTGGDVYAYDPKGRRDPFLSIIEASKLEKEGEKKKKGLKPSETYDVADIKVIAIAKDRNKYYAMIQLPDKKYFTIREGMTLGLYGGKVIQIGPNDVVVREMVRNYKGEIQPKDVTLRLRKEEGE